MSIFLSYGRADDEPFVKRLYQHLTEKGFSVWYDRISMPSRALTFLHEIRDAIHTSERVVVVLGPHALGSDYVRAEWQHALAEAKVVVPVLRLGTYLAVPPELKDLHCPDCTAARPESDGFSEIARILSDPVPPLAIVSGDLPDIPAHFQPRPAAMTSIAQEVLLDLESPVLIAGPERVVFIHGMGGTGKSVLAAAFARSTTTRRSFADGVVWLSASPETEPLDLLRRCGQLISGAPQSYVNEVTAITELRTLLAERRVLLVLDNIWNVEQVEHLLGSLDVNTRVLATTRDAGLATALGTRAIEIRELSEDAALQQLADWVHLTVDKLPAVAADLARECGYLPFALALNGAMLADKIDWNDLIAALRDAELDYADKRLANYPYPTVLKSIKVSIDALQATNPDALARYRELAAFDLQFGVPEPTVSMLWEHLGSTSDRNARKLLSALTSKALLRMTGESPNRTVLLHDLLIDYLRATGDDPQKLNSELLKAYRRKCPSGWPSGPNDGYFHRHLTEHLARAGRVEEVHELLAAELGQENAWYTANDAIGNIDGYLSDVSRAVRLEQNGKFDDRDAMRRQLGLQMRYALIAASIRSLASTIPNSVRTALVRTGVWSGARGLAEANQIAEASRRVYALVELIPSLDETLRSRAIEDALRSARMCGVQQRPSLFGSIVPLLDPAVGQSILDEALETARSIDSHGYRATALAGLVPLISTDRKEALINETLQSMALEVSTAGINQGGFDAFSNLAPYVEGTAMDTLISLLRLIPGEFMRARAYALTVRHVPKDMREAFAREGLELVPPDDRGMVALYVALALQLPETSETELFDDVVRKDTRQIDFLLKLLPRDMNETEVDAWMARLETVPFDREIERFEAYAIMLKRLPEPRREAVVAQLAVSAASLEFDSWRTEAYETLAPYLSREQVLAAKKVLNQIGDSSKVASAWVELMDHLDDEARHLLCDFVLENVKASSYLDVLVRLASHVEGPDRDRVLAVAIEAFRNGASMSGGMMSGNIVEETLALFAELAPPAWRNEILNAALNNIFQVPRGADWGARGFVHLIPQLPADLVDRGARVLLSNAAREAVEQVTTSISGETKGSQTLMADVIETLAEFLSEDVQAEAVELAQQIQDRGWRMGALLFLSLGLPEPQRTEIINEAIVTQEILDLSGTDPEENYWRPLLALANLIADADLKSRILSRALTAARALDKSWRARGLIEIGKQLEPAERAKVMMEVIPINHIYHAHELAAGLPPDKAREVLSSNILATVRHYEWSRGEAASAFIDTQSREAQYDLWMQAHTILNEHPRATLASRLPGIAPLIRSLAGPDVIQDATHTLLQVNRWWPGN